MATSNEVQSPAQIPTCVPAADEPVTLTASAKSGGIGRSLKVMRSMLRDIPLAVRREWNYFSAQRPSAILTLTWRCTSHCQSCRAWLRPNQEHLELTGKQWVEVAAK